MNQFWPVVFPLVRPTVMLLAKVVIGLVLVSASLWGVKYFLSPGWLQAEASLQTAQAQLDEARLEQSDVHTHWLRPVWWVVSRAPSGSKTCCAQPTSWT